MNDDPNDQPPEWPMPKRTMSLKTFRDLLRRREKALARLHSQPSPTTSIAVDKDVSMEPVNEVDEETLKDGDSTGSVKLHSLPSATTSTAVATDTPIGTVTKVGGESLKEGAMATPMETVTEVGRGSSKDRDSTSSVETEKSGDDCGNSMYEGPRRIKPRVRRRTKEFLRLRNAIISGTPAHELWRNRFRRTNEDGQRGSQERQGRLGRSSSTKHIIVQAMKRIQEVEERFNSQTSCSSGKKFGEILLLSHHINRLCAMSSYPIARQMMFPHINRFPVSRRPSLDRTNIGLSRFSNLPEASTSGTGNAASESGGTSESMDDRAVNPRDLFDTHS